MKNELLMENITNTPPPVIKKPSNLTNFIPETLRTHCVSVRLNNAELQLLNTKRGSMSKGEWLRKAFIHKLPSIIPEINIDAWKALTDISQKLNRIAIHIDGKSRDSQLTHTESPRV